MRDQSKERKAEEIRSVFRATPLHSAIVRDVAKCCKQADSALIRWRVKSGSAAFKVPGCVAEAAACRPNPACVSVGGKAFNREDR